MTIEGIRVPLKLEVPIYYKTILLQRSLYLSFSAIVLTNTSNGSRRDSPRRASWS